MKARSVIHISIIGLLFIVLIQLGGMIYAYKAQMKVAEQSLNKCFWMAFTETVDDMVNNLPYPDGTVVNVIYFPHRLGLNQNEFSQVGAQQTAQTLQKVYKQKEFPLAKLDSVLQSKLEHAYIKGNVTVERFNTDTGEILESTHSDIHANSTAITSEKAFIYKEEGEAVRAIVIFPFGDVMRNVLFLFAITFLLLGVVVYALVLQIKSLIGQQHNLRKQQQDFYTLAEQMRIPVSEIVSEMPNETWEVIEKKSTVLLGMTEKTLSNAKAEALLEPTRRKIPLKAFSVISIAGLLLLLSVWAVYVYHISYRQMELRAQEHFEKMFYEETYYNRYISFLNANKGVGEAVKVTGTTPYVDRVVKNFRKLYLDKGYHIWRNYVVVYHVDSKFEESYQLRAAYIMQDSINNNARTPITFSLQFADSVFGGELRKAGVSDEIDIHQMKYPSQEVIGSVVNSHVGIMDMTTKLIPLNKDSTECVRGIVRSPQKSIIASIWYMILPLGITFLFMCACVYFQIRIWHVQRKLKQFQKDFTYSMIHDMKSPLSSIMMGAHILVSGKLADKPEKMEKYKQVIIDECEHLLALSGRVLMLTQIERGELELHKEIIPLAPLLKDITEKYLLKATKKVSFMIKCEETCSVYADIFCLREILGNLIDNAIKYSKDEVEILLSCEEVAGSTIIKVRDNGIGIPLKEQWKIFNKFERLSANNRKSGISGFGLGLSYVLQVMKAHDGMISVESVEGSYSEFTMRFPLN